MQWKRRNLCRPSLGDLVIQLMEEFFPEILDAEFTANMEGNLDHVEEGTEDWVKVLAKFYESFEKRLEVAEDEMKEIEIQDEVSDEICEKCGRHLVYKMGRFGKFLACSGFPDCRNTKPIVKDIGVTCPKCAEGKIIERRSKKGRIFYGCDQYPGCDYVSWDKPTEQTMSAMRFQAGGEAQPQRRKAALPNLRLF